MKKRRVAIKVIAIGKVGKAAKAQKQGGTFGPDHARPEIDALGQRSQARSFFLRDTREPFSLVSGTRMAPVGILIFFFLKTSQIKNPLRLAHFAFVCTR